ncbi:MAG: prenyltransferase/squalene oxidase repeat-containing protein [Deltaproteobacteria bacterium]
MEVNFNEKQDCTFDTATKTLSQFIQAAFNRHIEVIRIARVVYSLQLSKPNSLSKTLQGRCVDYIKQAAYRQGGWADAEETAWTIIVLSQICEEGDTAINKGKNWLESVRHPGGGWGRHPRDQVRIPTTALVIALVPSVATDADRKWVRQVWEKDLNSPVRLSYKGAFYLLTVSNEDGEAIDPLVSRTIAFLADDQNNDGGFGPWRDHPIGSDPWSTGVVLWGLSKWIDHVSPVVVEKALVWLEKTQLPSGYWPYHYLDEGTSYALIGAVAASRALANRK